MSLKTRKEKLKNDVISVLSQHPEGVRSMQLWQLVNSRTGGEICARDYGIAKMSKILKEWTDVIEVFDIDKCRLKNLGPIRGKQNFVEDKAHEVPAWDIDDFPSLTGSEDNNLKSKQSNTQSGIRKSGGKSINERSGFASQQQNAQQSLQKPLEKLKAMSLTSEIRQILNDSASKKQSQACAVPVVPSADPVAQPGPITKPPYVNIRSEPLLQGFRDAKHLTFQPIHKRMFENKDIGVHRVYLPRGQNPSPERVDNLGKECIEMLADANLFVSQERVEKLVCQRLGCSNIRQIGFRSIDQVPCVNELNRQICKINTYILAFVKTRSICTLHELKEALQEYEPNKEDFVNLKVGPLQRFPVVFEQFRFPPDQAEIPEITSMDILDHIHTYLTKYQLWSKKIELEPFMDYLVEQYNADDGYMLGVRIRSLPLALSVLKKAQRDEGNNRREIEEHFKQNLKNEIDDAFRKFRANILQTGSSEEMEVRSHYLKMRPELAIAEIFDKFNTLIKVAQLSQITHSRAIRLSKVIQDFIKVVQDDELGKSLIHLAICITNTTLEQSALKLLAPPPTMMDNEDLDGDQIQKNKIKPPKKSALVESLKKYIEKCLNAGALSLTHLHRIEEKLLEDFSFQAFHMMGFGTFLEFLLTEAKQMLEENGGLALNTGSGNTADGDVLFKPHQADILEFIAQCKQNGLIQAAEIEAALCQQYYTNEVRHLGHGSIARLLDFHDKRGHLTDGVYYESALLQSIGVHCIPGSKVGILGHQTKDAAKICLHNCPLLENLADWSQWYLVFEPELGKLKDFIQKNVNATTVTMEGGRLATLDFMALEVKPGELLKVVSSTSPEQVAKALEQRDVIGTSGHLVSMAVAYKGIKKLPMALLSGHMKSTLLQMHAESPDDDMDQNVAAMFVLQCLLKIPTRFCVALANQVFLDPLGQVVGSTKSKQLLPRLCKTVRELNHLIELGCLLGIQEWTNLTQQKCVPPHSSIEILTPEVKEYLQNEDLYQETEVETECSDDTEVDFDEILAADDIDQINDKLQVDVIDEEKMEEDTMIIIEDTMKKAPTTDTLDNDALITDDGKESGTPSCKDIVNQICKDEFGVGVQLSEDGHRLMKVQQERLGRSLDRLSKDLYSKDTHFVLELIQNADDNSYHDDLLNTNGECPSVKFIIDTESIRVMNNELGFQERDIKALCDVGRSTKGKHKFGYIGQKGIGFKSVFRVTDAPEVHSNGYHIKFDVNSGPMGYIQPHWIPESEQPNNNGWMTQIVLKLKSDERVQTRTLAARFNDIHPSLLLFLHRLRQITVENKVENAIQTMRRRDVGNDIIEIENSDKCERWLVIKKTLDASKISLQAKSGADVESTEIALAFPIRPQGQKSFMQALPPKQPVFAFLPLRSYGFRFIIQGDFDVPSSREDVDRDSPWNQWLRNEIHTLFIDSLDIFKNHPEFTAMEAVCMFLQFVPMEDEVYDFFKPVSSDILKKLKARSCVPTQPNSQGILSWKLPSQTVRARDPLVRTVITSDLLQKHLNLYYLHSDVAEIINPTLTTCLGIETLTSEHLYQLGHALIVHLGTHCVNSDDVILISKWLACMYRSLDEFHHEDTILTKLKSLQMLPLSDGELVSLHDRTVFYPITDSIANSQKEKEYVYFLQQDINSLHPMLLTSGDDEVNIQVRKLLLRLGIKQFSPADVINRHIIPILKSDSWKTKPEMTLISYLNYIKEQTDKDASVCNLDELKSIAVVKTKQGFKTPSKEPVHFSPQYGNKIDLQHQLSGYDWTFLDTAYLPASCPQPVITSYHNFFVKLGVEDCLSVRQKQVHLQKEELKTSPWYVLSEMWPKAETEFIVEDYYSPELEGLIKNNKTPSGDTYIKQMRYLCIFLDSQWESNFSKYCVTCVKDKEGKIIKDTETSLSILLRTAAWLPAVEIQLHPDGKDSIRRECNTVMKQAGSLYIKSDTISRLLSDKVLYLDAALTGGSFTKYLGLKDSVATDTVKEHVLQWGRRTTPDEPAVFCTSLQHIKCVYSYLFQNLNKKQIQELLRENVYFVPNGSSAQFLKSDEVCAGKMLGRNEIWLADKTGLFDRYKKLLEDFHSEISHKRMIALFYNDKPDVQNIFRMEGKVDGQPKVHEYIELLVLLCSTGTPKESQILSDVLCIFTTIGQALLTPPDGMPDDQTADNVLEHMKSSVKGTLKKQKVFPTKKQTWVSLEEHPMIADNREWEKMFANKDGVHFLDLDDKERKKSMPKITSITPQKFRDKTKSLIQPDMIKILLEICEVKKLSEVVKVTIVPGLLKPCVPLQKYFHLIVPGVQQFIKARFPDVYQQLEQAHTQAMLKDAKFYEANKLEVTYRLSNMEKETFEIKEEKCVIESPTFYFHSEHLSAIAEITREVARHFSNGNANCCTTLRNFLFDLSNIVSGKSEDTVEDLLERNNADNIEIDPDEMWHVVAPMIVEMNPEPMPDMTLEDESLIVSEQRSDTNDGPLELKAWPPVSNESRSQTREKSDQPASNIWPPPQAKDYMRSVRDLPSNIRFLVAGETDETCVDEKGNKSNYNDSASDQTRIVCPGQYVNNEHDHDGFDLKASSCGRIHGQDTSNTSIFDQPGPAGHAYNEQHETSVAGPSDHSVGHAAGESVQVTMVTKNSEGLTAAQVHSLSALRDIYDGNQSVPSSSRHRDGTHEHSNIQGTPKWTQLASEYTFDELELGSDIKMSAILNLKEDTDNHDIGYWGEALVAEYLTCQKNIGKIIDFTWKNKSMETGSPYDFEVRFADDNGIHVDYIEVKSTVSADKEICEISVQQIKFAAEKDNFHIYRVFNAGNTERVKLIRINNLDLRLSQKQVKLCMYI